jgi:hypothetical protein
VNHQLARRIADAICDADLVEPDNGKAAADIAIRVTADEIAANLTLDSSVLAALRFLEQTDFRPAP